MLVVGGKFNIFFTNVCSDRALEDYEVVWHLFNFNFSHEFFLLHTNGFFTTMHSKFELIPKLQQKLEICSFYAHTTRKIEKSILHHIKENACLSEEEKRDFFSSYHVRNCHWFFMAFTTATI